MNLKINNKGISMVESLIAIFLTAIAIVSIMPMQDTAIRAVSRSDYMGRAQGVLQSELEFQENRIMNSTDTVTAGVLPVKPVYVSGLESGMSGAGDASFDVLTTISANAAGSDSWIVNVKVTWQGNRTGITSSIIASKI